MNHTDPSGHCYGFPSVVTWEGIEYVANMRGPSGQRRTVTGVGLECSETPGGWIHYIIAEDAGPYCLYKGLHRAMSEGADKKNGFTILGNNKVRIDSPKGTLWSISVFLTGNGTNWTKILSDKSSAKLQIGDIVDVSNLHPYMVAKQKPNFVPHKPPRKGSEDRQKSGERERNVGHPNGEEHSRVPKGNGSRRFSIDEDFNKNPYATNPYNNKSHYDYYGYGVYGFPVFPAYVW